jgi:uncharacterized membrane protein
MSTPLHRRGWIPAAIFLLVAVSGLVLLMLAPELDTNPLVFMSPG